MAMYEEKIKTPKEVKITRQEALEYQLKLINEWEPKSEIWSLRYGGGLLAAGSVISSIYLMGHYRRKLKLLTFGKPLMFVPGVIVPSLIIPLVYQTVVTNPLILGEVACPVCIQLRAATVQASFAVLYPAIVHTLGSFSLANSYATYRLPAFSLASLPELFGLWKKISRPLQAIMPFHLAAQMALAFFITECQAHAFFNIQEKIIQRIKSSA